MFLRIIFLLIMMAGLSACAGNRPIELNDNGELINGNGLIIVSAGRSRSPGSLPFVSYGIYQKGKGEDGEKVGFLAAEAGLLSQLGSGKYGFIHIRELPTGSYYLVGQKGRGNAAFLGLVGGMMHFDSNGRQTGMVMEFDVEEGVVTYLGEVLTIARKLNIDAVTITNQSERDLPLMLKSQALQQLEVKENLLKKVSEKVDF